MKLLLVVFALVAVVSADWSVKTFSEAANIRKNCLRDNPVPADLLEKMKSWNYTDEESVRKYLLCISKEMGFWDENGLILERLVSQFKSDIDESEANSIVKKCLDDNKKPGPPENSLVPTQQCIVDSRIGDKIKALIQRKKN